MLLGGVRDLGQRDVRAVRSPIIVRTNLLYLVAVTVRQHGLVEASTAVFGRVTLSLVFVIIHTVDVDDSLVVLS